MATTPPVPQQRNDGDQEPTPGDILSADLLRQVRVRRRQAKARRAAMLRSLALLRSTSYRES